MKLPLGYRYASAYAGIRKKSKDDLGLIVSDSAGFGRRRVHEEPRTGRAGSTRAAAPEDFARYRARASWSTRATPTAPHAQATRSRWPPPVRLPN